MITTLELECPKVLETWGEQKLEVNVDEIPPKIFASLNSYVTSKVGSRSSPNAREIDDISSSKNKKRKKN